MISRATIFKTSTNLALRGLSVISKLFLVIYLGKYFSLEDLGTYHIFAVSLALFVFVLGFEFHSFSSREYEKMEVDEVGKYFSNQLLFLLLTYFPGILLILGFFSFDLLGWEFFLPFSLVLFFDLLAMQTGVLLAARKLSIWFNFLFFLRGGLWIYAFVGWSHFVNPLGIKELLIFWVIGVGIALFLALTLVRLKGLWQPKGFRPDWAWIKKGVKTSLTFYVLVIFMRLIDYLDRYFLEFFNGREDVGIYSFFSGISNVPITLIGAAVTIQFMPLFLRAYREGERDIKVKLAKEYMGLVLGILLFVFAGVYVFLDPLLVFVDKRELMDHKDVLWALLIAATFFALGTFPQLVLYSRRNDKLLLLTGFFGLLVCIAGNYFLIPKYGIIGAAYAAIITRGSILLSRSYFSFLGPIKNSIKPSQG